ncbi:16S rRNA (guanine(527)-N(7))-methyltransferase RsmG [Staphylococcus saprophyticus]|jgi:16S rRNA (guanine527-N7)-methyltransferase|uniref:16S rRNA (guanine(527)-N(7))-methyltransferase RsmG n=1 Tax=Staphylococcus saprophyticus TaxID=29385 RepID=UPI0007B560FD|nr:16S rRNA (guanine(527)-N(7))-methyltransferase RsmG [Staphylococcus saprophyticus]SIN56606.1 16S rRNA m(7)G-527 methyltransferase [Mycobacteroides abscessus subsp. abscessus]MBC2920357.1 16S rRNA (guanine(527)-N(7))-methyltransferase RsmG [Staphylococcus saprophyticus]MBC2958206.1 16S rRNA (guanine(527)-N(7))-methyltransferase RsmG [Staphylococcus saprophyticus]MBC3008232.1 16S rRNA (guanine(527)-N(7))-methyltransferase RsmG [Staphylococcus saprophyticus]MBC3022677.1 16S rRNA (guanine(527)-
MSVAWLTQQLSTHGIELSNKQQQQFQTYYQMLVEWNEKMNLTSITEEHEVYLKHFYDSIATSFYTDLTKELTICDVGAGAGFPSIPLKIIFPNLKVTIVDSLNKRIHFLNQLAEALELDNVSFVHDRAETYGKGDYRASYDIVTARAVARLSVLSELCLPLVKKGGHFIALKSSKGEEELEEARFGIGVLGGKVLDTISYELPEDAGERQMIIIDKRSQTPKKYPRKPGTPNKSPLLEK